MTWEVTRHENEGQTQHESWDEARTLVVEDLVSRIDSLLSDITSNCTTGTEIDSINNLIEALSGVSSANEGEDICVYAEGIEFSVQRVSA
jgi:hypothetical protein